MGPVHAILNCLHTTTSHSCQSTLIYAGSKDHVWAHLTATPSSLLSGGHDSLFPRSASPSSKVLLHPYQQVNNHTSVKDASAQTNYVVKNGDHQEEEAGHGVEEEGEEEKSMDQEFEWDEGHNVRVYC